jgi:hypothetical protein
MTNAPNWPQDINFLSPLGFKFTINKLPNFEYFVQSVDFPRLGLNTMQQLQTPFNRITLAGDHVSFDEFTVTFKIDEDMYAYFELYDWIVGAGKPESFDQYNALNSKPAGFGVIVDASLIVLNSAMQPNIRITFNDVIPVGLSGFTFDSTREDVSYLTASATFKYRQYVYERVT